MADIRLKKHANYTLKELEEYLNSPNSCVHKINTNFHISILPYSMENFKRHLLLYIIRKKVSFYDAQVEGIVLDVRNIKLLNSAAALRANDPHLHIDLNADFYVFRPAAGALVNGLVKYVGDKIVGVTIYKVFSAQIRFNVKIDKSQVCLDQELQFRIKDFDLQNIFPYIVGELPNHIETQTIKKERVKKITFEENVSSKDDEIRNGTQDLDELVALINEQTAIANSKKRKNMLNTTPRNGKRKLSASSIETTDFKIKAEEDSFSISGSDSITSEKIKKRKIKYENLDESIDITSENIKKRKTKHKNLNESIVIEAETEETPNASSTIVETSNEHKVKHKKLETSVTKKQKKNKSASLDDSVDTSIDLTTSKCVSINVDSGEDCSTHENNSFQIKLKTKKAKKKSKKESLTNGTAQNDSKLKVNGNTDCIYID
ncbi:probable DNA-directed RNA polymerase I subunit RPA43 [Teleopsis dalmanni]|uniref:probable DNA-directed RNA polymerase I subunit RPA43 n=1 Tax=Teleopsis dalmanni TaxID=139649 RepID=UPI0018CE4C98|nr:probable DNA-directed RNA polymerase I subunit RPA43 [Teleopsis dalmanni]